MADLVYCLTSLLCFDILLLYCYISLNSSIFCCLSSGDIYLSLGVAILLSTAAEIFCSNFFEAFVIPLATLLPIKSRVASAVFWIAFFETVLNASVVNYLAWLRRLWLYLLLQFLLIFLPIFFPYISAIWFAERSPILAVFILCFQYLYSLTK